MVGDIASLIDAEELSEEKPVGTLRYPVSCGKSLREVNPSGEMHPVRWP
jgi:hypothetical protein